VDEAASNSHLGEDRALRPFTADDGKKLYEHCDEVLETRFKDLTDRLVDAVKSQQSFRGEFKFFQN
jgi:uracil-DNA glycosylase